MAESSGPRLIPFYGAEDRALFDIERQSMDRDGHILAYLDSVLPDGRVLDIGAGDGFCAERLCHAGRSITALEPASGMLEPSRVLLWVRGAAQQLPFEDASFAAAYATFAYFFPSIGCGEDGLREVERVLTSGGPFVFVDSAGDDELTSMTNPEDVNRGTDIASPHEWWHARGFQSTLIETSFKFETLEQARALLGLFFGDIGRERARLVVGFNAIAYHRRH